MKLTRILEDKLVENIGFGISVKGKEAAEVTLEKDRILVEIKNPVVAAKLAVKGYLVAKNLKKLKSRILKAGKKVTVKYGFVSVDI
ncbi:MAG: hypothetical protein V1836_02315 [Candidatus Aenigmatarchaeota archaeon]